MYLQSCAIKSFTVFYTVPKKKKKFVTTPLAAQIITYYNMTVTHFDRLPLGARKKRAYIRNNIIIQWTGTQARH